MAHYNSFKDEIIVEKRRSKLRAHRQITIQTRRTFVAYSFLIVPLLFFLAIRIYPTLYAFVMAFSEKGTGDFSLVNFERLLTDTVFWKALLNTFLYVIITVPIQLGLGLLIALAIEKVRRFKWLYRTIYFLPYITSVVAVSWVWKLMYDKDYGFFNEFLGWFGITPQTWLSDPKLALLCISAVMIWQSIGFSMLIFMAGLQVIPKSFYEAAKIDGSNSWSMFWKITFPLLNPTLVFLVVTGVIEALQTFTQVQNLAGSTGGPLNSTVSIAVYMYKVAFLEFNMVYAAAIAIVLFLVILVVTIIQMKLLNKSYEY
ncbi:carbohydrate ABC transporter permease [Metabacillus fastidiosus]|uniref:Sugar ABC transporter permease n=1 Tax=Metabacillus fastidiosus TaxID=1458 RepID=A0ABU6NU54_9BACI|nr:sugar ABC transporter permease [Metabacillus fastidiosus]